MTAYPSGYAAYHRSVIANLKMIRPINIYAKNVSIHLEKRRYRINALGGFSVKVNEFNVSFSNLETKAKIKSKRAFWPVQTHSSYGRRAKRVFIVDIPVDGTYSVNFHNPNSIKIKRSNLLFINSLKSHIPNEDIEILITTKYGGGLFID